MVQILDGSEIDPDDGLAGDVVHLASVLTYEVIDGASLLSWLEEVIGKECPGVDSFAVQFVDDPEIARLNGRFRNKPKPTDVLSFPGEVTVEGHHLGDVVISVPTAQSQAQEAGLDLDVELKRLLLHGLLHCLGFDHETDEGQMDVEEQRLRRVWMARDSDAGARAS